MKQQVVAGLIILASIVGGGVVAYLVWPDGVKLTGVQPMQPTGSLVMGIMGAYPEDFALIKSWGANTVHIYKYPGSPIEIAAALTSAKQQRLKLLVSVAKIKQFDDTFDLAGFKADPEKFMPDYKLASSDPDFLGYWLIDEPCNPKKKSPVQSADLQDLYTAVKQLDAATKLIINFGTLECLQGFVDTSQPGWQLADMALFTVTPKKLQTKPNYLAEQAAIAASVKKFDPAMQVVPQIGVVEYQEKNSPLPAADWVITNGLEANKYLGDFDGVLYYSFHAYDNVKFIGDAIDKVQADPAYIAAFKQVFAGTK